MPTSPNTTPPAAPQMPPGSAGFFIPQSSTTPTKNVSESPVLTSPAPKAQGAQNVKNTNAPGSSSKRKLFIGLGAVVVILALVGGGAGVYLTRESEDIRQQASTPSGSAQISLSPATGTLEGGDAQQIAVSLNLATTPVTLSSIELSIAFSGEIPTDLEFQPLQLQNFRTADTTLEDSPTGKTLRVVYALAGTDGFSATTSRVNLGSLSFTNPASGQMSLRFNASESKVVIQQSNVDILRPPTTVAYTFESPESASALQSTSDENGNEIVDEASSSGTTSQRNGNQIATESASLTSLEEEELGVGGASTSTTPTPTPTSALLAQVNTTTTPTRTPTLTPIKTTTLTPTPTTDTRSSSLPADTQDKPVSGSMDATVALIGSGLLLILSGVYFLPKKKLTPPPSDS